MADGHDYFVKDINDASRGLIDIEVTERDMPGLLALRETYGREKPLAGARIAGCLHMTQETAALIRTLVTLGADVRWSSCNIYSTDDNAAAAIASLGVPVYAYRGETVEDYWKFVDRTFQWGSEKFANLILDDGGDATMYLILGAATENGDSLASPENDDEAAMHDQIRNRIKATPGWFAKALHEIIGVSEETTTGVSRLYQLERHQKLPFAAINVNDSVTKSKFDNIYGCRESLLDGIKRATGIMIGGKTAIVAGYGDVGKGCARALSGQGARVVIIEVDPICALQAAMEGFQVTTMEKAAPMADLIVTATGCTKVVTIEHIKAMKDSAILCNIGHFDNEIDMAALKNFSRREIRSQVDEYTMADGKRIIVLADGRLVNLGCANGHPAFVMSTSFTNQVLAQIELFSNQERYRKEIGVTRLPARLDEHVARLHLAHLGVELSHLTGEQANYLGINVDGPFKSSHYRY